MKVELKNTIVEKTIFEINVGECFRDKDGEIYIKTDHKRYYPFVPDVACCSLCDIAGWDCVDLETGHIELIKGNHTITPLYLKVIER